ncbi:hypothetical protein BDR22DRAFT_258368 [Usnea florida]
MEALPEPQDGDQNRGPAFLIVALLFFAFALMSVLLRLFARVRLLGLTGWDDLLISLAMAFSMITAAFDIVGVDAGFGRHVYYLLPSETTTAIKYIILSEVAFNLSLATSKSSICVFLLSLIKNSLHNKSKRFFLYSTIALLFVTTVISVSLILATCRPTPKIWDPTIPGTCDGYDLQIRFSYFSGTVAAWVDFSLAAFPISFIKDLQISKTKKVALWSLLSVGVFAGICAVVRTILGSSLSNEADITWALIDEATWAIVETNVSIIVACIPTMKPLYTSLAGKLASKRSSYGFVSRNAESHKQRRRCSRAQSPEYPMMTFPWPPRRLSGIAEENDSEKDLRSDAAMPGFV